MNEYITVNKRITEEIVEKKSKFIANIFYIESIQEAEQYIQQIKKEHYGARHNCYSYRILENKNIVERACDDGEPSGTAGAPMLNIITKNNLCNILIIVTRYFGGILLGTGGLVRAYSEATMKAIQNAEKNKITEGYSLEVKTEYNELEPFKYYCKNNNINIVNIEYNENIKLKIELNEENKEKLLGDFNTKKLNIIDIKILCKKFIITNI